MKKFITVTALTLASLASFSSFAASVSFPDSLSIVGINGETKFDTHQTQLARGNNFIELKYKDNFEFNADDTGAWVKSAPLYLILNSNDHGQYQAMTPVINTKDEAHDFINNPMITLRGTQGRSKDVTLLTHYQLINQLLLAQK